MRKEPLVTGYLYHICTKSIAGYTIFRSDKDYSRMLAIMEYYSYESVPMKFSTYLRLGEKNRGCVWEELKSRGTLVDIVAYCIMPTHLHLVLCQLKDGGISRYMKNLLNSYTRYFNTKNRRKGPLWQGRFKSILVKTNEQLLHLTRYIHLNPTTDGLVDHPGMWPYSSYNEYIREEGVTLCSFEKYLEIDPKDYQNFVESRKDYQRDLAKIKDLLLD